MENGKDIHEKFTDELREKWENLGFDGEEVQKWIEKGSLEPNDAGFALFLRENGHIPETVDDILDDLRKEYNKMAKEIGFFLKEEVEEKEIIVSSERDGNNIHRNFTPGLIQQGQEYRFSYEETNDGISAGMGILDVEFCAWLRDMKEVSTEWILNHGNAEQLQSEYQEYCLLVAQQEDKLIKE